MICLYGELSGVETLCHLMVISEMEEAIISIPNPFNQDTVIDLYLTLDRDTINKVELVNNSPYISTDIKINAKILSSEKNSNYFEKDNLELIKNYASSYVKSNVEDYLYKTSKEFKSDINNFGTSSLKNFFTDKEYKEYNWHENYKNAFFDVEVDTSIKSGMLLTET